MWPLRIAVVREQTVSEYRLESYSHSVNAHSIQSSCALVTAVFNIYYAGKQWVADLKAFKTTWTKEYLTEAPWILLIFKPPYSPLPDGRKVNHYYHEISTSICCGILLAAIQVGRKGRRDGTS